MNKAISTFEILFCNISFDKFWELYPKKVAKADALKAWNKAIKRNVLEEFVARDAQFKFVVKDAEDLREIIQLKEELSIPRSSMWLMPEGRTREEILTRLPWLFDVCSDLRFNLSARLHVLAHNDKRGV